MISENIIVLDGGMGRELERIGAPFSQPLWSAQALIEAPDTVTRAHLNFIEAGAQVITTNAYALVPNHLGLDLHEEKSKELIALSATLAAQAVQQSQKPETLIAGCVPPVFGSYDADAFKPGKAVGLIRPFFKQQVEHVDLWIVETITSWNEAEIATGLYRQYGANKPLWLAYTMPDDTDQKSPSLHSGEGIEGILTRTIQELRPDAILFNCCSIDNATAAISIANKVKNSITDASHIKIGAYANAFEKAKERSATVTSELRTDITPELYTQAAQHWVKNGAQIIGGCCGIMPDHITSLAQKVKA
jgi:S-methylmethionine-dependent homocysteine/selenocysteine methylase